jgi:hypothetical protein
MPQIHKRVDLPFQGQALPQVVRVVNTGDADFLGHWNKDRYVVPAGGEAIVPYDAAVLWLGDPRAVDLNESKRPRLVEYRRLRVRYGAYDDEERWEKNKPRLECHTLDGQRVLTVVDDPAGDYLNPEVTHEAENRFLRETMQRMQAEMKVMRSRLDQNERAVRSEDDAQTSEDTPGAAVDTPPRRRGRPRKNPPANEGAEVSEDKPTTVQVFR